MGNRPPGRPRKRKNGIGISAYIDGDIYEYLQKNVGPGRISDFINEALRYVIQKETSGEVEGEKNGKTGKTEDS